MEVVKPSAEESMARRAYAANRLRGVPHGQSCTLATRFSREHR